MESADRQMDSLLNMPVVRRQLTQEVPRPDWAVAGSRTGAADVLVQGALSNPSADLKNQNYYARAAAKPAQFAARLRMP